jgi:hypothetical protein
MGAGASAIFRSVAAVIALAALPAAHLQFRAIGIDKIAG